MNSKKIGIISFGYGWLPCEPGPSRFYYISKYFKENGWDVTLVGGTFQHFLKEYRDMEKIRDKKYPFKIAFIEVTQYKKNVSLKRVISNKMAESGVITYLKTHKFDVVYCSVPPNNIAAKVAKYCHDNSIKLIIDIEDLWPEAMRMIIKNEKLCDFVFHSFKRDAEIAYKYADAIIGTSEDYTKRATKYNHRDIEKKTVYVGCDIDIFDKGKKEYEDSIDKNEDEFWVTYAGSLGKSYDIETIIKAAASLYKKGYKDIKFKILGTGVKEKSLKELKEEENAINVEFVGYVPYEKMASYLSKSDVVINSFIKGAPQSIPNKIGDYLASKSLILNTLENEVTKELMEKYSVGVNVEPENEKALTDTIEKLYNSKDVVKSYGENARKLCEEKFDRKKSYMEIINMADTLLEENNKYPI